MKQVPSHRRCVWAVVGPTASGKSALAMDLAERIGGEIISVDSAQVFRGLDIGTAKPTRHEQAKVRHHLIDIIDPNTQYNAALFRRAVDHVIADLDARGREPILCGGTGLWLKALSHGLFTVPDIDPHIRAEVREAMEREGSVALHAQLHQVDPEAAARLHPHDKQRIARALEVVRHVGVPLSLLQREHAFLTRGYCLHAVAPMWPRNRLNERIEARTRAMFDAGLIEETRMLIQDGADPFGPGLSCIGYKETVQHIRGESTAETARDATIVHTRQYAKRQMNWFRSVEITWLDPTAPLAKWLSALSGAGTHDIDR